MFNRLRTVVAILTVRFTQQRVRLFSPLSPRFAAQLGAPRWRCRAERPQRICHQRCGWPSLSEDERLVVESTRDFTALDEPESERGRHLRFGFSTSEISLGEWYFKAVRIRTNNKVL